jgi:menaquinone-dependent protoporphyrinogen oxidase
MNALVAYASKHGSTAEIAAAVAETLQAAGIDVDCVRAGAVESVDRYDAVVLGSAVYARRWRPEARRFLRRHGRALAGRPLWIFSSGPVGAPENDAPAWMEPGRTMRRVEQLGAREHVVFGGRAPVEGHGMAARAMAKNTPPEYRDRRDWDAIRDWANRIAADLGAASRAA